MTNQREKNLYLKNENEISGENAYFVTKK